MGPLGQMPEVAPVHVGFLPAAHAEIERIEIGAEDRILQQLGLSRHVLCCGGEAGEEGLLVPAHLSRAVAAIEEVQFFQPRHGHLGMMPELMV